MVDAGMLIKFKTRQYQPNTEVPSLALGWVDREVVETRFCCSDAEEAWRNSRLSFDRSSGRVVLGNVDEDSWLPAASFCPFCGAPIRFEETRVVKMRREMVQRTRTEFEYVEEG